MWHQHHMCAGDQLLQQHGVWFEPGLPEHYWLQSVWMCFGLQIVQRGLCSVELLHFQRHVHGCQHILPQSRCWPLPLQGGVQDMWHQHHLCAGNQLLQQHRVWFEPSVPEHNWF
jgi:hypothetical protein